MADPRIEFLSRIDLAKTRVRAFDGFILLCGGPREVNPTPILSVRHMIYNELTSGRHGDLADRLKLAEDIQDWFRGGVYKDLVTFEEHLAGLSAVIVLVVESAGAIAELGTFAIGETFAERLLVLIAEIHYEAESFIRLGPILRLENRSDRSVMVYDWHDRSIAGRSVENFGKVQPAIGDIVEAIRSFTSPTLSERVFKAEEDSHSMLLICELCDLFGALQQTELQTYLSNLGISVDAHLVEKYLFLLQKCGLLKRKKEGHGVYYYAPEWRSRISFGFTAGPPIERDRLRIDVAEFYAKNIKSRFTVVQKISRA